MWALSAPAQAPVPAVRASPALPLTQAGGPRLPLGGGLPPSHILPMNIFLGLQEARVGLSSADPPGPSLQGGPGSLCGNIPHQSTLMIIIKRFLALPSLCSFLLLCLVALATWETGAPPGLALKTEWAAQAPSTGNPALTLWGLASPGDPGWRRDSSPVQLAPTWAEGLVAGAHGVIRTAHSDWSLSAWDRAGLPASCAARSFVRTGVEG